MRGIFNKNELVCVHQWYPLSGCWDHVFSAGAPWLGDGVVFIWHQRFGAVSFGKMKMIDSCGRTMVGQFGMTLAAESKRLQG